MSHKVDIGFHEATPHAHAHVEIAVPAGTTRAELGELLKKVMPNLEKFRPRGCLSCLSGLDIHIRERFEHVLTLDV